MNLDPGTFGYELKIIPEKEKKCAQINVILSRAAWSDLHNFHMKLAGSLPADPIIRQEVFHNNTLFLEVEYDSLESITRKLEALLASESRLVLTRKQIFIKKLGGWFDF